MRRALLLVTICAVATLIGAAPASAQCPDSDGTLPGSSDSVTRVGTGDATPYTTVYVDDRDYADLDDDGTAGGLWIYIETNGMAGLQRGGGHVAFSFADPEVPAVVIPPQPPTIPGGPYWPSPIPITVGGWHLSEGLGFPDKCTTDEDGNEWTGEPDSLLF